MSEYLAKRKKKEGKSKMSLKVEEAFKRIHKRHTETQVLMEGTVQTVQYKVHVSLRALVLL